MLFGNSLTDIIYLIPVILLSLSFHEFSHAYVSYKLGDPTAKNLGRLTLNPMKHLDIIGTLMMLLARVGWAKPVPLNPLYYKNQKRGTVLVSIAGPVSNLLLAFIFLFPFVYLGYKYNMDTFYYLHPSSYISIIYRLLSLFVIINLNLAVFNIIPVPPLDGSKILSAVLPQKQYFKLMQYENYIGIVFLIIIFINPYLLGRIITPVTNSILNVFLIIVKPIVSMLT